MMFQRVQQIIQLSPLNILHVIRIFVKKKQRLYQKKILAAFRRGSAIFHLVIPEIPLKQLPPGAVPTTGIVVGTGRIDLVLNPCARLAGCDFLLRKRFLSFALHAV